MVFCINIMETGITLIPYITLGYHHWVH